MATLQVV